MSLANFKLKRMRHRAVSLRHNGFLIFVFSESNRVPTAILKVGVKYRMDSTYYYCNFQQIFVSNYVTVSDDLE